MKGYAVIGYIRPFVIGQDVNLVALIGKGLKQLVDGNGGAALLVERVGGQKKDIHTINCLI